MPLKADDSHSIKGIPDGYWVRGRTACDSVNSASSTNACRACAVRGVQASSAGHGAQAGDRRQRQHLLRTRLQRCACKSLLSLPLYQTSVCIPLPSPPLPSAQLCDLEPQQQSHRLHPAVCG